jgi:hypothetical protein
MLPPLSPLMRSVLLRFDSETTETDVTQFLDEESVREPATRARAVLEALCNIGTLHREGAVYRVTQRGERVRDQLLADLAEQARAARPVRRRT